MSTTDNFNDDSLRSDKFKPHRTRHKSGVAQEKHERMVADALRQLGMAQSQATSFDVFIAEASRRAMLVRQYAKLVVQEHFELGKQIDNVMLAKDVSGKFLDNFAHYDKDQLLLVLTQFLTETTLEPLLKK